MAGVVKEKQPERFNFRLRLVESVEFQWEMTDEPANEEEVDFRFGAVRTVDADLVRRYEEARRGLAMLHRQMQVAVD